MNKNILTFLIILAIAVLAICIGVWFWLQTPEGLVISSFEECAVRYPVMESYPRQCNTPDGRHFVETIQNPNDKSNLIIVDSPKPGDMVKSPLVVKGKARGNWFFEASFPVQLMVGSSTMLVQKPAQAQGEWMTTEFVPFEVTLDFEYTFGRDKMPATLILQKDNPSGLPEHDDSISIPLTLVPGVAPSTASCRPTGCSGQVCSDKDVITTCEYRADYACYKTAKCERQSDGECGGTPDASLLSCLKSPPPLE